MGEEDSKYMQNGLLNLAVGCHKRLHKAEMEFSITLLRLREIQNKSLLSLLTDWPGSDSVYTVSASSSADFVLITANASHQSTNHLKQGAADTKTEIQEEINSTDLPQV